MTGRIERTPQLEDSLEASDLPPVVARLVVEIRSDGTRTIARGALEDRATGQRVDLRADSTTPVALARELTRVLLQTPVFASTKRAGEVVLGLLPAAMRRRLPGSKR